MQSEGLIEDWTEHDHKRSPMIVPLAKQAEPFEAVFGRDVSPEVAWELWH